MNRLVLALAGAVLVSSCSDSRDRRTPVEDNLTRPLEVARVDTTQPLSPIEHQATKSPEPAAMPKPRKAKRPAKKPAPPAASLPAEDSTARGYAPVPDTAGMAAPDSNVTPARDTAPAPAPTPAPDTVASRTSNATTADSASSAPRDTAPTPAKAAESGRDIGARTLPIGTEIHAALDDSINSRTDTVGRVVTAVVMENVTGSDGKTLIPAGAPVRFTVTRLGAAKSKSGQGNLALQVDGIGIGGQLQRVSANVQPVPHELRGRGVGTSEAAKVGVGAVGGAVLGRVIGGSTKGAVIGGVVGAAGGAVVASQTASRDVVVKARTPVTFVLTDALVAP
ncbi:MAG: glycine zipper 2TM domain-containing protein [Gemmatimonadales bacterium]